MLSHQLYNGGLHDIDLCAYVYLECGNITTFILWLYQLLETPQMQGLVPHVTVCCQ